MFGVAGALALGAALPMSTSALAPVASASDATCGSSVSSITAFGDQRIRWFVGFFALLYLRIGSETD